jgi:ABC-type polysaccharide/polyol phosphate transport system ATPase subunit
MNDDAVIRIDNVSKKLRIGSNRGQTLLSSLFSMFSGVESKRVIWPLRHITFEVKRGDRLGIIGLNGSGKSTLLRLISGIYKPTEGQVRINGNIQLLTNLSTGLKSKLTVKDNVYLVGSILSLEKKHIDNFFDEIIEFAGLEDFVYSKLYQLSSGMRQRIAFSITSHCVEVIDPDILLLDEVFAGGSGDEEFKVKSTAKLQAMMTSNRTLLLASHNMSILNEMSQRIIWLHKGEIGGHGISDEMINGYLAFEKKRRKIKNSQS